jgi:phenylacetate-CoA ligase
VESLRTSPLMDTQCCYEQISFETLEQALSSVPGYASWGMHDPGPATPIDLRYSALPVLTKQDLRDHFPHGFVPRGRDLEAALKSGEVEFAKTSGSTEDQVTLVFHVPWWEASEQAAWQLNHHARTALTGRHREAVIASPRCVGPGYSLRDLSMQERTLGRHLYLNQKINPASWTDADIRRMAGELNHFQPVVLEGDPAYLAAFSHCIVELGIRVFQPQMIFLTYSYPSRIYLRLIRKAFCAPTASSYGSTETGHVFMECEAGSLHQNVEHCRVDFQPWHSKFGGPELGSMYVTVLRNPWFSLLRFDIGDVARRDPRPCPCGRNTGLTLSRIEGRIKDVTFTPEGLAVTVDGIDKLLTVIDGLYGWQIDQADPQTYRLRVLSAPVAAAGVRIAAAAVMRRIYGPRARIEVERTDILQHELSGKIRFARALFPLDHSVLWA